MRRWRGVLCIENEQTGDGRVIAPGALTWAELPLPLAWITGGDQHIDLVTDAPVIGNITRIWREDDTVWGEGVIDDTEGTDGAELVRRMTEGVAGMGTRERLSIDPDDYELELVLPESDGEDGGILLIASGQGPLPALRSAAGDPDPGDDGGEDGEVLVTMASDDLIQRYTRMRIRGVTACAVSAFAGAYLELLDADADAEEGEMAAETAEPLAVAASAATTTAPPAAWFAMPEPDPDASGMVDVYGMPVEELLVEQPDGGLGVPLTITDDGRVFGHIARWGQCHVGYGDCVTAPESQTAYAHFHHGQVVCDDGTRVATGTLTVGCDHAAATLRAPEARDHYAHAGLAFADVRVTNGALGAWCSGAIRPDVTDEQLRLIRASSPSGDWRRVEFTDPHGRVGTNLELVAALAVSVPGFPIAREAVTAAGLGQVGAGSLAASARFDAGEVVTLTAAGMVHRCRECQQRALAAAAAGMEPGVAELSAMVGRMVEAVEKIELRTRHLTPAAAAHALSRIRAV